jgi:hypothetical protein
MRLLTSSSHATRTAPHRTDWEIAMTLLYSHHDRLHGSAGADRHPIMRTLRRVRSALRTLHRAIAAAKIRRIRHELILHRHACHWAEKPVPYGAAEYAAAKYPQRPLVLGDKWDF